MNKKHSFRAVIQNPGGGGAFVEVPFDVEAAFSSKKPKVKALIEGFPYRGTLVRMGTESHLLLVLKSIREQSGKTFGDEIKVMVELDEEERLVELPPDLRKALIKEKAARAFFDSLAFTRRREYVNYILEAKREATRKARVARVVQALKDGKKER